MTFSVSLSNTERQGPHCRALSRGAIGDTLDGRSREAKFIRRIERELFAQIGEPRHFTQTLLIRRAARVMLQLELLDAQMQSEQWSEDQNKMAAVLTDNLRLTLRDLGVSSASAIKPAAIELKARA
jgi:hypothetical protein